MRHKESGLRRALWVGSITGVLSLLLAGCSVFGGKAANEPAYRIIEQDGDFEIREYTAFAVAETTVTAAFDEAVSTGFRLLFRYISGDNRTTQAISMTAPVIARTEGEEIAMTAPVIARPENGVRGTAASGLATMGTMSWTIAFVLPDGYTASSAPSPTASNVTVRDVAARRVASIRFPGRFQNEIAEMKRQSLADWLEARAIGHKGDWQFAGYNPPWTIPALRRNEILVSVDQAQGS